MAPNPNLGKAAVFGFVVVVEEGDDDADASLPISVALRLFSASFLAFSSASSRSRSYPNWRIRSSSSRALRSAAAKSTALVFCAPNPPSLDFLAAVDDAVVVAVVVREEREAADEVVNVCEADDADDVVVVLELVRLPRTGGVAVLAGVLDVEDGLGVEGLDHDSKKSSSSCRGGDSTPVVSIPSTCIPFGYLIKTKINQVQRVVIFDAPRSIFLDPLFQFRFV
jgi:hypothetical protein